MKKRIAAIGAGLAALILSTSGWSQTGNPTKIAVINIQVAIAQSNDGQEAARTLGSQFAPKRAELEKLQKEIADLQQQLRNQEKTLAEEARSRLLRTLDDKTRAFTRANEDATSEYQQAEQDAINAIGVKMLNVITDYAQKNAYSLVIDVASPQTPVLYAEANTDITEAIINLYNEVTAKAAGGTGSSQPAAPADQPAATAPPAANPAGSAP
ncbi:MAG: OmpH family outer membrane protein [Acidobacteria bacterium]|nr:OmpH family outer membrane protein [Acidobacteriota bacterium]